MKLQLTKSDYMMYLKHPAWLWLKKHDKDKLPPVDANLQAIFDAGHKFEPYAHARFPGGVMIGFSMAKRDYGTMPARTRAALDAGEKVLFEGRVESGQLTCIFDVLEQAEGGYHLYEIKSTTREKQDHIVDLAFQQHVLELCGLMITGCSVIVADSGYVRQGEVDPLQLTRVVEVTEQVAALKESTAANIAAALAVMDAPAMPDPSPRHATGHAVKDWIEIFLDLSATDSDPYSIYRLSLDGDSIGELEDQGIALIKDIPPDFPLARDKDKRTVQLSKLGAPMIDAKKVADFLRSFRFPLYFFDYETMSSIIPPFPGTRPYQQLPIQYSLHILREPGAELEHKEFLHRDSSHPGLPLLTQLVQDIGTEGTVLAWYDTFEKGVNASLGELFPDYKAQMAALNARVLDLMTPFAEGWYEDFRFLGSASIKKVLPVLVPDLTYKALTIQNGEAAQRLWMETVLDGKNPEGKEQLFRDLLEYCGLDTYAMVRIYQALLERSAGVQ